MTSLVDVSQADRETAEDFCAAMFGGDGADELAQAFARHRLTAEQAKDAEIERLQGKLRMIVSHASGGSVQYTDDQSVNDISVGISQHHNRIWEHAREEPAATIAELTALLREARSDINCYRMELAADGFDDDAEVLRERLACIYTILNKKDAPHG